MFSSFRGCRMERDKIQKIVDGMEKYNSFNSQISPYIAIYGEDKKSKKKIAKPLRFSSSKSKDEFTKVLNSFSERMKKYIYNGMTFKDLKNDNDSNNFIYKVIDEHDLEIINELTKTLDTKTKLTEFLHSNKFENVFFLAEIYLDESAKKKILLLRSVSSNYAGKNNKFISKFTTELFTDTVDINFVNIKKEIILDTNFEIAAFINTSDDGNLIDSFLFIQNRLKFENLFKYHERYEIAYSSLTEKIDFIKWNLVEPSLSLKRLSYNITNFDDLEESIKNLRINLKSQEINDVKRAFSSKKIKYEIDERGNLNIMPENKRQLRSLLKIIKDELAKTCLLGRSILGSNFEELE